MLVEINSFSFLFIISLCLCCTQFLGGACAYEVHIITLYHHKSAGCLLCLDVICARPLPSMFHQLSNLPPKRQFLGVASKVPPKHRKFLKSRSAFLRPVR